MHDASICACSERRVLFQALTWTSSNATKNDAAADSSAAADEQAKTAWETFRQTSAKAEEKNESAKVALANSSSARQAAEQQAKAKQEVDEALRLWEWLIKELRPRWVPACPSDLDLRDVAPFSGPYFAHGKTILLAIRQES